MANEIENLNNEIEQLDTKQKEGVGFQMIRKVLEYKIVQHFESDEQPRTWELEACVNRMIADGWEPLGPVVVDGQESYTYFFQTMVRYAGK